MPARIQNGCSAALIATEEAFYVLNPSTMSRVSFTAVLRGIVLNIKAFRTFTLLEGKAEAFRL